MTEGITVSLTCEEILLKGGHHTLVSFHLGGRERGRERGRGGKEGRREGGKEGGRERGKEGRREGGRKGGKEGGRKRGKEGEKERRDGVKERANDSNIIQWDAQQGSWFLVRHSERQLECVPPCQ